MHPVDATTNFKKDCFIAPNIFLRFPQNFRPKRPSLVLQI